MKNTAKKLCVLLATMFVGVSLVGCGSKVDGSTEIEENYAITLTKTYNGKEVMTLENTVSRYVKNVDNYDYLANVLHARKNEYETSIENKVAMINYDYQKVNISWESTKKNDNYTVYVADNENFTNAFTYITKNTSVSKEVGIFIPNQTYYYKVVGSESGSSKVDSFVPVASVRYISADTVFNVRDLGGWTTKDGKKLNYGKIYRGAALDEPNASHLSENAKNVFDYLGIKGEIDLRADDFSGQEAVDYYQNKINPDFPILREGLTYLAYEQLYTGDKARAKNNLPKIFEFLANEDNYPVYFHCSVGADRTGTLAYVLETLLGVEYDTAMVDFELTSFTRTDKIGGVRRRSTTEEKNGSTYFLTPSMADTTFSSLGYVHSMIMNEYESYSTDSQKVMEKYLRDVGVSKAHIDKVKEIMLG